MYLINLAKITQDILKVFFSPCQLAIACPYFVAQKKYFIFDLILKINF